MWELAPLGQIKQSNSQKWGCQLLVNDRLHCSIFRPFFNDHSPFSWDSRQEWLGVGGVVRLWPNEGKTPTGMPSVFLTFWHQEQSQVCDWGVESYSSLSLYLAQRSLNQQALESPGGLIKHRLSVPPLEHTVGLGVQTICFFFFFFLTVSHVMLILGPHFEDWPRTCLWRTNRLQID